MHQGVRRWVWDTETSVGDWGGPETVWALLCVAEWRATRPNGESGYGTRRHMLGPERPAGVGGSEELCTLHAVIERVVVLVFVDKFNDSAPSTGVL